MKIWLINHYGVPPKYFPLARPKNFARFLQEMGHEVIIFAASTVHNSDKNLITDGQLYKKITDDGIHYVLINCHEYKGNGKDRVINMCDFARKLPGVCKHFRKPDAIVSTSVTPLACAMGIRLAKRYKCKVVAEIADLWPETFVAYQYMKPSNPIVVALRRLEKWIYKNADDVVFTMEGAYDYIIEQGWERDVPREKVHYINNGIDLEEFDYNKEHYQIEDADLNNKDIFKIVYTGSIRRVNNVGKLLDIAKEIDVPNVKFLVWGDGDELELLRQRVIDENVTNFILKGSVEKKYIPYITSLADINFVHSTQSPIMRFGMSLNKMFDYFAAGKPIVIDCYSKYNPILSHDSGYDICGKNIIEISEKLKSVINLPYEQLEETAVNARKASEEYDFRKLTWKLVEVLKSNHKKGRKKR